jgi:hypothetical protein
LRLLPGGWIDAIGRKSSHESRKYNNTDRVSEERRARLRRLYREYAQAKAREGYAHVLLGHSHLEDHIPLEGGEYLNLGFSPSRLAYGLLEEGATSFRVGFYP